MRYVTVSEALVIAEAVTGIPGPTLARASRLDLLESALHAPQAAFGHVEFYPDFVEKAGVLVVRVANNHPLMDGNKRLAWAVMNRFCVINGCELEYEIDEAVDFMLAIAAGDLDEAAAAVWIENRIRCE